MDVILDTNVYRQDLRAASTHFDVLIDYTRKTGSVIVMPELVHDELVGGLRRDLRERNERLATAHRNLSKLLPHRRLEGPKLVEDVDREVSDYIGFLKGRLASLKEPPPSYADGYLADVVSRAIERRRPCSAGGEEIRDALLWLIVLDTAEAASQRSVVFISNNKAQFADATNALHADLQRECAERGVTVRYFLSLEAFAREHAVHLAFATKKWFQSQLDPSTVLERAHDQIIVLAERTADFYFDETGEFTGDVEIVNGELTEPEFYVYELDDGSLRIDADYVGQIELSFGISWIPRSPRYDDEAWNSSSPDREFGWRSVELDIRIAVEASVEHAAITDWKVTHIESI